jgi:hypothetical protein
MKTPSKLLIVFSLALLINSCKQECSRGFETIYVDESYLPSFIPYSDTSTRLFLKNGTDTLLFKSQGLVKDFGVDFTQGNCTVEQNLQRFSLKMKANDSDYFTHTYVADRSRVSNVFFNYVINRDQEVYNSTYYLFDNLRTKATTITVLNNSYDSSFSLTSQYFKELYINPKIGLIKVRTAKYSLELIK